MDSKPSYTELEQTLSTLNMEIDRLKSDKAINRYEYGLEDSGMAKQNESEEKFRDIYENISDWIYVHDLDGRFIENSPHFIKSLGYNRDELKGANVRDLIPERFKTGFDDYLKRIIETGNDSGNMRILTSQGTERTVEYKNILIQRSNGEYHIQGVARDVTERVEAEKALKKNEQKYRSILDNIYEGYYEVDIYGNFTFVNKALCQIMGYEAKELIGMNNQEYMDEYNARHVFRIYNKVFNTGESVEGIEFDLKRKDGQKRNIVTSVTLIYSDEKKPVGYRGIARDVTDKTRLENDIAVYRRKTQNAKEVTIMGLAKLSEYRDNDAGSHLERIREFSKVLAQEISSHKKYDGYVTPKYVEDIYQSSILHDIGKVGIPDAVLLKPGKLTPEEFSIIKEHSRLGGDALSEIESKIEGESFLTLAKEIAYHHHERWNGKGYPKGLKADEIPLSARIVALADVYDALTSKRVYKEAFSHEEAIKIIVSERGKQFDPDIVDGFMVRNKEFVQIRKVLNQREAEALGIKISLD